MRAKVNHIIKHSEPAPLQFTPSDGGDCLVYDGPILPLLSCSSNKVAYIDQPWCDGAQQGGETGLDTPWDADGDGFVDGHNPDCQESYPPEQLDCDDADYDSFHDCEDCDDTDPLIHPDAPELTCDEVDNDCDPATADSTDDDQDGWDNCSDCNDGDDEVHPGMAEITCKGWDDDCDEATLDAPNGDKDGVNVCDDCDDADPQRAPGTLEICGDDIDQDCDETVDEGC